MGPQKLGAISTFMQYQAPPAHPSAHRITFSSTQSTNKMLLCLLSAFRCPSCPCYHTLFLCWHKHSWSLAGTNSYMVSWLRKLLWTWNNPVERRVGLLLLTAAWAFVQLHTYLKTPCDRAHSLMTRKASPFNTCWRILLPDSPHRMGVEEASKALRDWGGITNIVTEQLWLLREQTRSPE